MPTLPVDGTYTRLELFVLMLLFPVLADAKVRKWVEDEDASLVMATFAELVALVALVAVLADVALDAFPLKEDAVTMPFTWSAVIGNMVPMPTLPPSAILKTGTVELTSGS